MRLILKMGPSDLFLTHRIAPTTKDTALYACTSVFADDLVTIARGWKQPSCPSTKQWKMKMGSAHTVDFSLSFAGGEGMGLESTEVSEVTQSQRGNRHIFCFTCGS